MIQEMTVYLAGYSFRSIGRVSVGGQGVVVHIAHRYFWMLAEVLLIGAGIICLCLLAI